MGAFVRVLASVKTALEGGAHREPNAHPGARVMPSAPVVAPAANRAALVSSFARELEAVGGHFTGSATPEGLSAQIIEISDRVGALTVAIGGDGSFDSEPVAGALEQSGRDVIRCGVTADEAARRALIERIARADLAIVEAQCAIASTGTLVVTATPARPSALTLIPQALLAIVRADRIRADAAEAIVALGAETIANHRVAFITGPSRTADIEKLIVVGVHGPKQLHALVLWPADD